MIILPKISRQEAIQLAEGMTFKEIRQYCNDPNMDLIECMKWGYGLQCFINVVYNGKRTAFADIVTDYKSHADRKFKKDNCKALPYRYVLIQYIRQLRERADDGRGYTFKAFNKFLVNYTEI